MLKEQQRYLLLVQLFLDCMCMLIAYVICSPLSFFVIASAGDIFTKPAFPDFVLLRLLFYWGRYLSLAPLLFLLPVVFLYLSKSYHLCRTQKIRTVILKTGVSCLFTGGVFCAFLLIFPPLMNDIFFAGMYLCLAWVLFAANRVFVPLLIIRGDNSNLIKFLLFIGTNDVALRAARFFDVHPEWGVRIVGFLTYNRNEAGKKVLNTHKVLGPVEDFTAVLEKNVVDCVIFAGKKDESEQVRNIAYRCELEGMDFGYTPSEINEKADNVFAENLDGVRVVFQKSVSHSPEKLFLKRLFDISVSVFFIVLFMPLWIIIPVAIKRDSKGPAFFCQERVGKNGRRFIMYKFRSMVVGAEKMQKELMHLNEMDGPVFKIQNDPRFTAIGRFLRKTSIDELPQFFNVLKGDMSLVGPRPSVFEEVLHYRSWQKKRLSVIPGITCLWQVTGRNKIMFAEWMQLDLQYIENWSLTLDLKILVRTIYTVLTRAGAK